MSAFALCLGRPAGTTPAGLVDGLMAAQQQRAPERSESLVSAELAMAVGRRSWESSNALFGPAAVLVDGPLAVVTDATLYYRQELRTRLAQEGIAPSDDTPAALVLAAYRAWGDRFAQYLEGDFVVAVWDQDQRKVLVARDPAGRRTAFHAISGAGWAIASTARAFHAAGISRRLQREVLTAATCGFLGGRWESGFAGVEGVPAGETLCFDGRGVRQVDAIRVAPFRIRGRINLEESIPELRRLLSRAVAERQQGVTGLWLSGGADSTAVLGASHLACREGLVAEPVRPVTVSYPEGDLAREDEYVIAIAEQLGVTVEWLQSEAFDLFADPVADASERDHPTVHHFERANRALAAKVRSMGARTTLDGFGGDSLFHVSSVALADFWVAGDWQELAPHFRGTVRQSLSQFVRRGLVPWFPTPLVQQLGSVFGRNFSLNPEPVVPAWITPEAAGDRALDPHRGLVPARRFLESPSAYESRWYVTAPYLARSIANVTNIAQSSGVDLRSPIVDRRVVDFAASRPLGERVHLGASKHLLREAMRGILPDSVIAPRPRKTGIPGRFVQRQLRRGLSEALADLHRSPLLLADLGIVDPTRFSDATARFAAGDDSVGLLLFCTFQVELWLRTLESSDGGARLA